MSERAREAMESFFDFSRPLMKLTISEGASTDVVVPPGVICEEIREPTSLGRSYAAIARKQEEALMRAEMIQPGAAGRFSTVESLTSRASTATVTTVVPDNSVLWRYDFTTRKFKETLPIAAHRTAILSLVSTMQAVVLRGATGCGKSTQVPQYLLEEAHHNSKPINIVVTQPRRIAAATLARRVCADRGWELGSLVGYQVGLDKKYSSEDTRLMFCTTGVLLQRLVADKGASSFTHIIVDEVHERTQEMDFLLILLRKMVSMGNSNVKVLLMSATISVDLFSQYFTNYSLDPGGKIQHLPAPILDLDRSQSMAVHKVAIYYLEQLSTLRKKMEDPRLDEPVVSPSSIATAVELLSGLNQLPDMGAALVFLPGINEIEQLFNALTDAAAVNPTLRWWIKPLHSTLTMEEQSEVFNSAPPGFRKLILSTNIAESSITVPDIAYVVDFCLTKHLVCDPGSNFSSLQLAWASRSNCVQRAGRAGRTCPGRVYRLVPRQFFNELNEQDTAEMLRGPLERVVLLAKELDMGSPADVIGLAPEPPDLLAINKAVLLLKEKGAMLPTLNGIPCGQDGDLTFLGRLMSKLPLDPAISKLLLLGHAFGVLKECVIMGAAMTLKSIFSSPFQRRLDAYHNRLAWADGSCSDCICFLNAFEVWAMHQRDGFFSRPGGSGAQAWADGWLIQLKALQEVQLLVNELMGRLSRMGITEPSGANKSSWRIFEKPLVLKMVIAGAFYPNFFGRGSAGGQVDEDKALREVNGQDPRSTVYLTGMPIGQPKRLYTATIKKALAQCSGQMRVSGEHNTGRLYVTFSQLKSNPVLGPDRRLAQIPGRIEMGVYRAVKLRQLNLPIEVPLMRQDAAVKRATELGVYPEATFQTPEEEICQPQLPKLSSSTIAPLKISHQESVGHFWAQRLVDRELADFGRMEASLQVPGATLDIQRTPKLGHIYAAPSEEDGTKRLYRAQLLDVVRKRAETIYEVYFVDYGNRECVSSSKLRALSPSLIDSGILRMPPVAFECVLAGIAPSSVFNSNGMWSDEAQRLFDKEVAERSFLSGVVYSVVQGVVALTLIARCPKTGRETNINDMLVRYGHAQLAEESQLSKRNHEARERVELADEAERAFVEREQRAICRPQQDLTPPDHSECPIRVTLRGPTSPLEMSVYGMTREGKGSEVSVDGLSVNSVLLDTAPQDPHERLLVAASVGQNPRGTRITLRHTTLLPNIHGLPALLCLAFAPSVELRTDKKRLRYTGALCGLGTDGKDQPLFPKHDMEVPFDTLFSTDDLDDINKLRHQMNRCFVPARGDDTVSDDQLHTARNKIKDIMQKLLRRPRTSVPLELCPRSYAWNLIPRELRVQPCNNRVLEENLVRGVFQFHWGVRLSMLPEQAEAVARKITDIDALHEIVNSGHQAETWLTCRVCSYSVADVDAMAEHLAKQEHVSKEGELRRLFDDHMAQRSYDETHSNMQ